MLLVFAFALGLVRPAVSEGGVPRGPTPVDELSTKALRHHEVLRIRRDFGMDHWEIALDGWLTQPSDERIAELRLWWVNTQDDDRRKPFSAYLRRYLEFEHRHASERVLAVRMAGDRKEYRFTVELDERGTPAVFADVRLADGTTVPHCRCRSGRLLARRVIGIPVGIAELRVQCTDDTATAREGAVPFRELEDGDLYVPEPG